MTKPKNGRVSWWDCKTTYLVDVMAWFRRNTTKGLKTFGDPCNCTMENAKKVANGATRIDFVFDSYYETSVKDSDKARRNRQNAVDISNLSVDTLMPVDMNSFWASKSNMMKIQNLLRQQVITRYPTLFPDVEVVVSGVSGLSEKTPCQSMKNGEVSDVTDLDVDIEEVDARFIPYAMHTTKLGTARVVLLSSDTDVLVLALYFWCILHAHGLSEIWIRAGVGNTIRYIPLHTLANKIADLCKVLPAAHCLTGCDVTSKVGTKHAAITSDPGAYLSQLGEVVSDTEMEVMISKAEEYLVNVLKKGTQCKTSDELRYWQYHNSKKATLGQLAPTSRGLRQHILSFLCYKCAINMFRWTVT